MSPFHITNKLSQSDYSGILLKKTFSRPGMIFLMTIGLIALAANIINAFGGLNKDVLAFFPWALIIFPFLVPLMAIYRARRIYKTSARMQAGVQYTFTENGVTAKAPDSEWTYEWSAILKFEESTKFLLLFPTISTAEIIKKDLLTKEQIEFIRIKTGKYSI